MNPTGRQPSETERIEAHVRSLGAGVSAEIVHEQASIHQQLTSRLLAAAALDDYVQGRAASESSSSPTPRYA